MKRAIMAVYAAIVKINHATFRGGFGGVNPTLPHHFLCENGNGGGYE